MADNENGFDAVVQQIKVRFEELCRTQGLTKSKLARDLGTSRAQLDRLFNFDTKNVSIEKFMLFAKALGFDVRFRIV